MYIGPGSCPVVVSVSNGAAGEGFLVSNFYLAIWEEDRVRVGVLVVFFAKR